MNRVARMLVEPRTLLGGLVFCLTVALGWQFYTTGSANPVTPGRKTAGSGVQAAVLPDFRMSGEASTYGEMVARPLLNPSRRPAPLQAIVEATEPPKPQIRRGLYELVGVMDMGEKRLAQLRELAANRVHTVQVGERLQEFRVKSISSELVSLEFAGETDDVRLPKFTNSSKARTLAPPAPPPVAVATPQAPPLAVPQPPQVQNTSSPTRAAAGPVPVAASVPRPAAPVMDSRQQAEFLARRQEARRAWGDRM